MNDQTRELIELLEPDRLTYVVDIGANPLEDEAPYLALLRSGGCRVVGFEPQPEALARLRQLGSANEQYLPYAVGDGGRHELRICASSGFSSLLEPDVSQLKMLTDFPRMAQVVDRVPVSTTRLDDITEIDHIDHLKIDVQGGELAVFSHGRERLREATSIQVEVNFFGLYEGQPTFAQVDAELRGQGFRPQNFVSVKDWPLAPIQWADEREKSARQLVEADVLYTRDLARLAELDDEQLKHLIVTMHAVYGQVGVGLAAVDELVRRGGLGGDAVERYQVLTRRS